MKRTSEILADARKLIEVPDSWQQNAFFDGEYRQPGCRYCALGAIHAARGDRSIAEPSWNTESSVLADVIDATSWSEISEWNDQKGRTHAEVLAAFDKAIEAAKHLEQRQSTEGSSGSAQRE